MFGQFSDGSMGAVLQRNRRDLVLKNRFPVLGGSLGRILVPAILLGDVTAMLYLRLSF
jgi:hypothetical protein